LVCETGRHGGERNESGGLYGWVFWTPPFPFLPFFLPAPGCLLMCRFIVACMGKGEGGKREMNSDGTVTGGEKAREGGGLSQSIGRSYRSRQKDRVGSTENKGELR